MAHINSGKSFSIVYVTADVKSGRAGAVKEVSQASKHYQPDNSKQASTATAIKVIRNPNHFSNSTINIRIPGTPTQIRKLHVQLIRRFNEAIVK